MIVIQISNETKQEFVPYSEFSPSTVASVDDSYDVGSSPGSKSKDPFVQPKLVNILTICHLLIWGLSSYVLGY